MHDALITRPIDIELALRQVAVHLDHAKPRRYIEGVAISTNAKNSKGNSYYARGCDAQLPLPLLVKHDWTRPLGRLLAVEALANKLLFKGEIVNDDRLDFARDTWRKILAQDSIGISILGTSLVDARHAFDKITRCWNMTRWTLTEISVLDGAGADRGACVLKAWQA